MVIEKLQKCETVEGWQNTFRKMYSHKNKKKPFGDIIRAMYRDLSTVSEAIREDRYGDALNKLTRVFSWLNALASKKGGDPLDKIVWKKFPGICPYCKQEENCNCLSETRGRRRKDPDWKMLEEKAKDTSNKPETLNEWIEMFKGMYGRVNSIRSIEDIESHLFEEIGEIDIEYTDGNFDKINSEIADVFSHLCALYLKINSFAEDAIKFSAWINSGYPEDFEKFSEKINVSILSFTEILYRNYKDGCPICREEVCKCEEKPQYTFE